MQYQCIQTLPRNMAYAYLLQLFLEELLAEGKLPDNFDIPIIMQAAKLVMRWNLFEFSDVFMKQKNWNSNGHTYGCILFYNIFLLA